MVDLTLLVTSLENRHIENDIPTDAVFFVLSCRGKKTPAFILMKQRRRRARTVQHIAKLKDEESLHDNAVASEASVPFAASSAAASSA